MEKEQKSNNIQITKRFISLEKIIASKNPRLLKAIPKILLSWFKKLIHLDRINEIIYKYRDIQGADFAQKVLDEIGVKVEVVNPEFIPKDGRALIVSNHPSGGIDGLALMAEVAKFRKDILFPVNDLLCQLPSLKSVFIPINKYGRNSSNHEILNKAFSSDSLMMFFPAGTESKLQNGVVRDLSWKKTFINKAIEYKRDIVPVYIEAKNTNFFYRLAYFRRKLGIKANFELIFLPDEMFKQKNKTIRLTFSPTIPYNILDNSLSAKQWANVFENYTYSLKDNPNSVFDKDKEKEKINKKSIN
ncbi:MAG: 1-acyl-sn-glycerol-3-phosphate acyltransferase [Bacteroidales bacterium]|nr:1-acyl-sn-glycerol-3-phosphate acyltransferase [Bacteroidales bacterium]